jgi:toxin ParE1/3/4
LSWTIRLSAAAERDFDEILDWTLQRFGARQAEVYADILIAAIQELCSGPKVPGAIARHEISRGLRSLHAARRGRPARHLLLFRVTPDQDKTIDVIRILHDSMDLPRHLPSDD